MEVIVGQYLSEKIYYFKKDRENMRISDVIQIGKEMSICIPACVR